MSEETTTLRAVARADAKTLFDWVNSPDTRAVSLRSQEPVPWEHHLAWLDERLNDPDTAMWIAEKGDLPLGQVRLQYGESGLEVSIFVSTDARKLGVARYLLQQAKKRAAKRWPNKTLIARVKPDNQASLRLFEGVGYVMREHKPDHVVLVCE